MLNLINELIIRNLLLCITCLNFKSRAAIRRKKQKENKAFEVVEGTLKHVYFFNRQMLKPKFQEREFL